MELEKIFDGNELYPVFQPVVSLETGDVFGYEAFSRIEEKSVLEFFKKADKADKSWKLEKFCRKVILKTARLVGIKNHLFININPDIILDDEFQEGFTKKLLEKYAINSHKIILEVTEHCSEKKSEILNNIINHYRVQNFNIALDNVGCAYSGLERICSLNPDFIKIDMNIIRGIESDTIKQSMVKSLVQFCNDTGVGLIAVGIETSKELDFILSAGVHFAQGFFLGTPAKIPGKVSAQAYARIIAYKKNLESLKEKNKKLAARQEAEKHSLLKKQNTQNSQTEIPEEFLKEKSPCHEIGCLASSGITIFPDTPVPEVMNFFYSHKECTLITVVDLNQKVLGIMPHAVLADLLGGRFGFGLNYRKTIQEVMLKDFLSVDAEESVEKVASKAMLRENKNLYDPVIVEKKGLYIGVVTVKDLLDSIVSVEVKERTREITRKNRLLQQQQLIQSRDMKMAELVQKSFYPSKAPDKNGWKSAFFFKPMSSVSGDLYDFYYDKDGNFIGTGLFDVSGHGVASGLVGILSKYLAEKIFISGKEKPLEKIIQEFSETLAKEKGTVENYLTGLFLRMNGNKLEYVNGGHTDVLFKRKTDQNAQILGGSNGKFRGMFLGMSGLPADECSTVEMNVKEGDTFLLFTDCLVESRNLAGDELGTERLMKIFSDAPDKNPKELLAYVLDIFEAYTEAVPLRDDLTVIVLQYTGR